ncbi:MAG: hypothetical protein MJY71_08240 [Bacteroidaceae bacterium]|nr:hypothetical protein [Bacteroidaceae bacterium]
MMFELEVGLCERFPALSPFDIRRERLHEFCVLVNRLNDYTKRESKNRDKNGHQKIRRKAGDDWF